MVVGDTIYFDAITTNGTNTFDRKIVAYDTSNHTHWVVTDVDQSDTNPWRNHNLMTYLGAVGSTIYTTGVNYEGMGPQDHTLMMSYGRLTQSTKQHGKCRISRASTMMVVTSRIICALLLMM